MADNARAKLKIEQERVALRALRGDFNDTWSADEAFEVAETPT